MVIPIPTVSTIPSIALELVRGERFGLRLRLTNRNRSTLAWPGHSARVEVYTAPGSASTPGLIYTTAAGECTLDPATGNIVVSIPEAVTSTWSATRLSAALVLVQPGNVPQTILRVALAVTYRRGA